MRGKDWLRWEVGMVLTTGEVVCGGNEYCVHLARNGCWRRVPHDVAPTLVPDLTHLGTRSMIVEQIRVRRGDEVARIRDSWVSDNVDWVCEEGPFTGNTLSAPDSPLNDHWGDYIQRSTPAELVMAVLEITD